MSFASRIAALRALGTLVVGWQVQTPADIDMLRRSSNDRYVADPSITLESPYAMRIGWTQGVVAQPYTGVGDEGGQAVFRWKEMVAAGWGSPGVNHRFLRNDVLALQWAEYYDPAYIGLASRTDSGFMGGLKTNMIDLERGKVGSSYVPVSTLQAYSTNSLMELVVTSGATITANTPSSGHPSRASVGCYGTHTHGSFTPLVGSTAKVMRPGVWVVYTVQVDFGATWSVLYASWQSGTDPTAEYYVLDDYRNTDARWMKSGAQQAAITAGDGVALKAAAISSAKPHRFRMWMQYQDWTEPLATHDTMLTLVNPYMWGNPDGPDEAAIGQNQFTAYGFNAGVNQSGLLNIYGQRYTPYLQLKRGSGPITDSYPDVGPFPAGFAPAATWGAFKRYDSLIVNRGAIDPKFFGGSDPGDPPPTPPASVLIPSGMAVEETP